MTNKEKIRKAIVGDIQFPTIPTTMSKNPKPVETTRTVDDMVEDVSQLLKEEREKIIDECINIIDKDENNYYGIMRGNIKNLLKKE